MKSSTRVRRSWREVKLARWRSGSIQGCERSAADAAPGLTRGYRAQRAGLLGSEIVHRVSGERRAVVTPLPGVQGLEIICLELLDGLDRKQALFGDFMQGPSTMMRAFRR